MSPMKNDPSKAVVGAWIRLMRAQQATLLKIERAFRDAGLPPHAWYDALWELDQAGDKGLRPFEIERLEAAGYVERHPCKDDARGQFIVITPAGRAMRRRMWPVYAAALNTVIGRRISDREAASLGGLLD